MRQKENSMFNFDPEDMNKSIEEKIKKIDSLFGEALKNSKKPLLLFSGGSESLLLLAFLLRHKPDTDVLYVDMRMNFPDFDEFFHKKIKSLIRNLHYFKIDYDEESFVKKFGIPIYPGVEEIGYDKKDFSQIGLNTACSQLKNKIMKREFGKIKPDLTIMGFLASDKEKRYNKVLNHGYLQIKENENLFLPLALLNKKEVFQILEKLNFPHLKKPYFNEKDNHLHKGDGVCWMCSAKCFNNFNLGNWKLLKDNYPELWKKFVNKYKLKDKIEDLYNKTGDKRFKHALDYYF